MRNLISVALVGDSSNLMDMTDPRIQTVLYKLLPLAADQGWSAATLKQAGQLAGETPHAMRRLFPHGINSALSAWQRLLDTQTVQRVTLTGWESDRVRDKIAQAVWTRLELTAEHPEAFQQATRQRLWHPGFVLNDLWRSSDALWTLAGDTSTDYNHYSKRVLLSKLLLKTTLSYLGDTSPNYADTRAYLTSQIEQIIAMGQTLGKAKPVLNTLWSGAERMGVHVGR